MSNLTEILGLAIIAVLITSWYSPIQSTKNRILDWINVRAVSTIFTCSKCMGLILGLIITHNIYSAAIISLVAYIIKHIIDQIEAWYE